MMAKIIDDMYDVVNRPAHYQTQSGLEAIDVIKAFTEDLVGVEAVCTGNALKYLCRWKHKNGVEDLKKAVWYCNYLIDILETEVPFPFPEDDEEVVRLTSIPMKE